MTPLPDLNTLLDQGRATPGALLRLAFGGDVPGLSFRGQETVALSPSADPSPKTEAMSLFLGTEADPAVRHFVVHTPEPTRILFPPDFRSRPAARQISTLGHEALHALQFEDELAENLAAPHRRAPNIGAAFRFGHGPALEKILAAEETPEETALRHRLLDRVSHNSLSEFIRIPHLRDATLYYLHAAEIEARFGEIAFDAVRRGAWPRLPQNREEAQGFAALLDGTRATSAPAAFTLDKAALSPEAAKACDELEREVVAKLSPAQRRAFFAEAVPAFAAGLLQRCGEPEAARRFGLEAGVPRGREMARQLLFEAHHVTGRHWSPRQWEKALRRAEPETVPHLRALAAEAQNAAALKGFSAVRSRELPLPPSRSTPLEKSLS
ncbi:MAG: hypothetical protein PW734_01660 [Verrucomicrobium sp.]|nr:hypothetical protein [Verrucomicrobium sp.]